LLARSAADGRVAEVRAGLGVADRRQVVGRIEAEHHGGRAQGVGHAPQNHPHGEVLVGSGVPAADLSAAQQGRVPARAAPELHYAQQGTVTKPHLSEQTEQAWCLTVLTNALVTWTTEYYTLAVKQLLSQGRSVPDELLSHISPGHSDNINFFGVINVDIEAEMAKLSGGWRPLRPAQLRDLGL
jgi:Tn3 transposase DDE domain